MRPSASGRTKWTSSARRTSRSSYRPALAGPTTFSYRRCWAPTSPSHDHWPKYCASSGEAAATTP
ncbi:MAG: hypothetical protein B7X11_04720, partial [Acidobacteria bacterium 37-65-4]